MFIYMFIYIYIYICMYVYTYISILSGSQPARISQLLRAFFLFFFFLITLKLGVE